MDFALVAGSGIWKGCSEFRNQKDEKELGTGRSGKRAFQVLEQHVQRSWGRNKLGASHDCKLSGDAKTSKTVFAECFERVTCPL